MIGDLFKLKRLEGMFEELEFEEELEEEADDILPLEEETNDGL